MHVSMTLQLFDFLTEFCHLSRVMRNSNNNIKHKPTHQHILLSTIIFLLYSITVILEASNFAIFLLASISEQTGLRFTRDTGLYDGLT